MKAKLHVLLHLMMILLVISACQDPGFEDQEGLNEQGPEAHLRTGSLQLPGVIVDRYVFDDSTHLKEYYQALDAMLEMDNELFFDFVDSTSTIPTVHSLLMEDQPPSLEDMYKPHIADPVMMTILNEHYEFQVGDILVTYVTNHEVLLSSPNDLITHDSIRMMSKGNEFDFDQIPSKAAWVPVQDVYEALSLGPWCRCQISILVVDCDQIRVYGNCQNVVFGKGQGEVTVKLNGQTIDFRNVKGSFSFTLPIQQAGTIEACAESNCITGGTRCVSIDVDPQSNSCDPRQLQTMWNAWPIQGKRIVYHTSTYYNFWGQHVASAQVFYQEFINFKWHPRSTSLSAYIDDTRLNEDCSFRNQEDDYNACNNCNSRTARVKIGRSKGNPMHHCTGDVFGIYTWKVGLNTISTGNHEIPFECCE